MHERTQNERWPSESNPSKSQEWYCTIQVETVFPSPIETPEEASVGPAPEQLVARYAHNIIITGIIISSLFPPESSFQQNHNPK